MSPINSHTLVALLLTTWSAMFLAHYAVAMKPSMAQDTSLDNFNEKNNADSLLVHKRASFFVGSRYGRSGNSPKARRLNVVPRNDRFFLGSRYGKRSNEFPSPMIFDDDKNNNADFNQMITNNNNNNNNNNEDNFFMSCVFTGVKNLYRCNNMDDVKKIITEFTDTQKDSVEQAQPQQ